MAVRNLGTVAAVSGALVSTSLVYILPSLLYGAVLRARVAAGDASRLERLELLGARGMTALGVAMVIIGMQAALS